MNKKAKKDALKLQISFCKSFMSSFRWPSYSFQFSYNCKGFSDSQLMHNLFKVLSLNYDNQTMTVTVVQRDSESRIKHHQFNCYGELVWSTDKATQEFRIKF